MGVAKEEARAWMPEARGCWRVCVARPCSCAVSVDPQRRRSGPGAGKGNKGKRERAKGEGVKGKGGEAAAERRGRQEGRKRAGRNAGREQEGRCGPGAAGSQGKSDAVRRVWKEQQRPAASSVQRLTGSRSMTSLRC